MLHATYENCRDWVKKIVFSFIGGGGPTLKAKVFKRYY